MTSAVIRFDHQPPVKNPLKWNGPPESLAFDERGINDCLRKTDQPCYLVEEDGHIGSSNEGQLEGANAESNLVAFSSPVFPEHLGDSSFEADHRCRYAYYAGSMAHGISSADLVIALGQEGFMGSFGAGGVLPDELESAIQRIQQALPEGPYAFNLIHNPYIEALERSAVDLYLKHQVRTVEASAYMELTPYVVHYRVAGLKALPDGSIQANNRIIAKLSRQEVATKFMKPAPEKFLARLLEQRLITQEQANMAASVPMADDITVEADSGGHTDNRPLVALLPSIIALRNGIQQRHVYDKAIRVGAAGGIGTPEAALAAFMMGAAYVVTGSINQGSVEAGTSDSVRTLLSQAEMADVIMAPAFDMFEMGGRLQVLKRGTLFAMRAQKLADLYRSYSCIEDIPQAERNKLEQQIFQVPLERIWQETRDYFNQRDPEQIERANANPKKKMALIFRWYLGLASHWANAGKQGREMDYQVWCGPSMGAFNDWVRGSILENPNNRKVSLIAKNIMHGAAYLYRLQQLKLSGVSFPSVFETYIPQDL